MSNGKLTIERNREPAHPTRAYETWTDDAVREMEIKPWEHAASLTAPPPRTGFAQRWIRVGSYGNDDPTNTARKFREGWRPRPVESIPGGHLLPSIQHGSWAGCVGIEGMVLCERPIALHQAQVTAVKERTDLITSGLQSELQQHSTAAMPIEQERVSRVMREVKPMADA